MGPQPRLGISGRIAASFQTARITPLLALFALWVTPRAEEPQIDVTMATILLPWPGASASDVEAMLSRHCRG